MDEKARLEKEAWRKVVMARRAENLRLDLDASLKWVEDGEARVRPKKYVPKPIPQYIIDKRNLDIRRKIWRENFEKDYPSWIGYMSLCRAWKVPLDDLVRLKEQFDKVDKVYLGYLDVVRKKGVKEDSDNPELSDVLTI